jgi:hypothetical protein
MHDDVIRALKAAAAACVEAAARIIQLEAEVRALKGGTAGPAGATGTTILWMTYEDAGAALNTTAEGARRKAGREKWAKRYSPITAKAEIGVPADVVYVGQPLSAADRATWGGKQ